MLNYVTKTGEEFQYTCTRRFYPITCIVLFVVVYTNKEYISYFFYKVWVVFIKLAAHSI